MMKTFAVCLGVLLSVGPSVRAAEPVALDSVLARVREQNPDLRAARQAWQVKHAEVSPAGTWPDPTFTYVDERFPSTTSGMDPQTVHHYRIEQMVPFPGKLSGEAKMKYHEALIAESQYRAKVLDRLTAARQRYYQLHLTDQKISLAEQSIEILKNALRSAQSHLAAGDATASDVFLAQTELQKMQNDLYEQQQQRALIEIELNTLVNQPTETAWGATQPPPLTDLPMTLKQLQQLASENDPLYLQAVHEANHSEAEMHRSKLAFAPDFGLMAERETSPGGEAGRQLGISVSFPLWLQRPWGEYQSAKAHLAEATATSQAMENEVRQNVHKEYVETQMYLQLAKNYNGGVLPAAASSLRVAQQRYASGQMDFLRLLEAFRTWIETHNEYQDKLYSYGEHWSELEKWVGVPLTTKPMEMNHDH